MRKYRIFDHTADLGIEIYGKTLEELYTNAAFAVFNTITDLSRVTAREQQSIHVEGNGYEDLLINYLREILYLFNGEGFLLREVTVTDIDTRHLDGTVYGERFDPEKHTLYKEIKAVTYHQTSIRQATDRWRARVIFDV